MSKGPVPVAQCLDCGKPRTRNAWGGKRCKRCYRVKRAAELKGKSYSLREHLGDLILDAKRRKRWPVSVTLDELEAIWNSQRGLCAMTGRPMVLRIHGGSTEYWQWNSISLDRIDSFKGYELGNVHLVTYIANVARNTMSIKDFIAFCGEVIAHASSTSQAPL